jgi:hypothetical protein
MLNKCGSVDKPIEIELEEVTEDRMPVQPKQIERMSARRTLAVLLHSDCPGFELKMPDGQSPYTSYPFGMHDMGNYPWTPRLDGQQIFLQADTCTQHTFAVPCAGCAILGRHPSVLGILEQIQEGAKERTPWKWLSMDQMHKHTERLVTQVNAKKLEALNLGRMLSRRGRVIDDYKRFVLAVASGDFLSQRLSMNIH